MDTFKLIRESNSGNDERSVRSLLLSVGWLIPISLRLFSAWDDSDLNRISRISVYSTVFSRSPSRLSPSSHAPTTTDTRVFAWCQRRTSFAQSRSIWQMRVFATASHRETKSARRNAFMMLSGISVYSIWGFARCHVLRRMGYLPPGSLNPPDPPHRRILSLASWHRILLGASWRLSFPPTFEEVNN
jgi:hypothetical protein